MAMAECFLESIRWSRVEAGWSTQGDVMILLAATTAVQRWLEDGGTELRNGCPALERFINDLLDLILQFVGACYQGQSQFLWPNHTRQQQLTTRALSEFQSLNLELAHMIRYWSGRMAEMYDDDVKRHELFLNAMIELGQQVNGTLDFMEVFHHHITPFAFQVKSEFVKRSAARDTVEAVSVESLSDLSEQE